MSVTEIIQSHQIIGFSGSRYGIDPQAGELAAVAVAPGSEVLVGCAAGVDAFFRSRFPAARVLRVDSSLGRAGFARRSIDCVEAVSSGSAPSGSPTLTPRQDSGLWVSFPGGVCPSGLLPSASPGRCFSGSGSGSWASLAYAIGRGGAALVYLGAFEAPGGWGLVRVPNALGWWRFESSQVQLSLF